MTANFLALIALGGLIAGAGLLAIDEPHLQTMAAVAAAVIAPGFEPLAKVPLGIVLRRPQVLWRGLLSTFSGYAVLITGAVLAYGLLRLLGAAPEVDTFAESTGVKSIMEPS